MNKSEQGKKNRKSGLTFELKVRKDLESKGWIVSKWMNNVENDRLIPAKHKFNPFMKVMSIGTGFPDFVVFKRVVNPIYPILAENPVYLVQAVECKLNGRLDKTEKEKCKWMEDNKIFSKILIASKDENKIKYKNWYN